MVKTIFEFLESPPPKLNMLVFKSLIIIDCY